MYKQNFTAMSLEYPSFSFEVAVVVYHWKPTVDFVEVDVDGDVPGAQVKGMKVWCILPFAVVHSQRRPTEAGRGGGGQHWAGHNLFEVCVHVILTKIIFL